MKHWTLKFSIYCELCDYFFLDSPETGTADSSRKSRSAAVSAPLNKMAPTSDSQITRNKMAAAGRLSDYDLDNSRGGGLEVPTTTDLPQDTRDRNRKDKPI